MNSERMIKEMYVDNSNHSLYNSNSRTNNNDFGSHAPGIKKAMMMLEVQFGRSNASPINNNHINDVINTNKMTMMNAYPNPYHHGLHAGSSSQSRGLTSQKINVDVADGDDVEVGNKNNMKRKKDNIDDGRIHSLPFKKHGPYTCSKCYKVLDTSQKFANHVASAHYKLESEEERKKRYMSRIRKRSNLKIQKLNNGTTTLVPVATSSNRLHASFSNRFNVATSSNQFHASSSNRFNVGTSSNHFHAPSSNRFNVGTSSNQFHSPSSNQFNVGTSSNQFHAPFSNRFHASSSNRFNVATSSNPFHVSSSNRFNVGTSSNQFHALSSNRFHSSSSNRFNVATSSNQFHVSSSNRFNVDTSSNRFSVSSINDDDDKSLVALLPPQVKVKLEPKDN
ncbi:unnamed protein product [Lathyrus sativus]|nr:unnamed protein product [Lathyrus sativus]